MLNFEVLKDKYIEKMEEESKRTHPVVKGRYSVTTIATNLCIHDIIRLREKPEFSKSAKLKMFRGKTLHKLLEDIYKVSGHDLLIEDKAKRVIELSSERVPGKSFYISGVADIVDRTDNVVVEFKTIDPTQFNALTEPDEKHVAQGSVYAYMFGMQQVLIIYADAVSLSSKQFTVSMDRSAVVRAIETADVLFYYDEVGRLPERIPKFLVSETCPACIKSLQEGVVSFEQGNF